MRVNLIWPIKTKLNVSFQAASPVVMMADLMAAGLHVGFHDFTVAATPATCGHAMDVPETRLNWDGCFCPTGRDEVGIQEARMFTPGAATSGCKGDATASLVYDTTNRKQERVESVAYLDEVWRLCRRPPG